MTNYTGTSGDDTLVGSTGDDNIGGLEGNDVLIGLAGNDMLVGDAGDDTFFGGSGNDGLFGGSGTDTADYGGSIAAVTVRLVDGNGYGGEAQGDTLFEIENVVGSGYDDTIAGDGFDNLLDGGDGDDGLAGLGGDDFLFGRAGNDTIDGGLNDDTLNGGAGSDALLGGDGSDVLKGAGGADRLYGGDGFDVAAYNESAAAVTVSLAEGSGSGGDAEGDLLNGVEALIGSGFGDGLTGDAENNFISGLFGDDRLDGLAGSDSLSGDSGKDVLDGGIGADTMVGGDGDDVYRIDDIGDIVDEKNTTGTDLVESAISFSLSNTKRVDGAFENLTLLGSADIDGTGNDLANTIVGNAGANRLDGKGSADTLHGRAGNDTYVVDNAGDVVDEGNPGSSGIDAVESKISFSLSDMARVKGQVENLTLTGTANIDGIGSELGNVLTGNAGANVLSGLGGNDTLTGGAGADRFVFDPSLNKKTNVDTITDFTTDDTIVLDHDAFGNLKPGVLKVKAFHEGKKAHDGNDRIIYNEENGQLIYDKNGDHKGKAVKFAILEDHPDLSQVDFFVV